MTDYPIEWQCRTLDEARAQVSAYGLYPDELRRLDEAIALSATINEGHVPLSATLRQTGTIGMVATIGEYFERLHPGIYVFDARNEDALRWFDTRTAAAEYYDALVTAAA